MLASVSQPWYLDSETAYPLRMLWKESMLRNWGLYSVCQLVFLFTRHILQVNMNWNRSKINIKSQATLLWEHPLTKKKGQRKGCRKWGLEVKWWKDKRKAKDKSKKIIFVYYKKKKFNSKNKGLFCSILLGKETRCLIMQRIKLLGPNSVLLTPRLHCKTAQRPFSLL